MPVETVITLGRKSFSNTKTLLLHFGIGRHFMVSCKISLQSQTSVIAFASQLAADSIAAWTYSSLHQKKTLKLSGYYQHFTFNLIIRIETVTNCGEEAGSRIECFCQHWGNSMLSLRQLKGYRKNRSWCRAQVSCPIYLA